MESTAVLGVPVHAQRFEDAVTTLKRWAGERQPRYVSTCTVYTVMTSRRDPAVWRALNQADMVTADGMPLVWLQQHRGYPLAERVYGPDVMLALCEQTAAEPVRHFFLGGLPGVAEQLARVLQDRIPGFQVAGCYSPPVTEVGTIPDTALVERLNHAAANVIWVGLGSPKQDLWMSLHRPYLHAPLLIGIGAAFDFLSGTKRQAPAWMQRSGLEWSFRLMQEPRRLWKRYLVYNTLFLWSLWQEKRLRS